MDDEAETYKLWRIRKTVMQVRNNFSANLKSQENCWIHAWFLK